MFMEDTTQNAILPKDIVLTFREYSDDHPFKILSLICYDEKGLPLVNRMAENWWAINTINAVGRALMNLHYVSVEAYEDMVHSKLRAKDKGSYNSHGLISAMAELSIMNTFIVRSSDRKSFVYEDHVRQDSNKNVEFSIRMDKFLFHVEVKTSNLLIENQKIGNLLQNYPEVLVLDGRVANYKDLKNKIKIPFQGSLDNRIVDFLRSANDKFSKTQNANEINLLVVCWDDREKQPILALKSERAAGILTNYSFLKDAEGNIETFPNIDCILVNGNYAWFQVLEQMLLGLYFRPDFPLDPFFQVFVNNYLIDCNLTSERIGIIDSIIQRKAIIADEKFANQLPLYSIASHKEGTNNVIHFEDVEVIPSRFLKSDNTRES